MPKPSLYNGVVVVDKPGGMTSHDVVDALRRIYRTKRVGHTGTLDPDATGVLGLCLGQATRLVEYLAAAEKEYVTEVVFGIETDTQDGSGVILKETEAEHLTEVDILALLPAFRGTIQQIPPMVSARHHEGKRLYELAREGVTVEREARPVTISSLELTGFTAGVKPRASLVVRCSTGTYIRTLAADMGSAAGTGAIMQTLRRTRIGKAGEAFTLDAAYTLDALRQAEQAGTLGGTVISMEQAVAEWTTARLNADQVRRFQNGQPLERDEIAVIGGSLHADASLSGAPIAVLNEHDCLCGVAEVKAGQLQPVKVFPVEIAE